MFGHSPLTFSSQSTTISHKRPPKIDHTTLPRGSRRVSPTRSKSPSPTRFSAQKPKSVTCRTSTESHYSPVMVGKLPHVSRLPSSSLRGSRPLSSSITRSSITRSRVSSSYSRSRSRSSSRSRSGGRTCLKPPTPLLQRHALGKLRSCSINRREPEAKDCDSGLSKSRPWTTGSQTSDRVDGDPDDSNLEDQIFFKVKDVLSRAVLENGRIDQDNVDAVIQNLKNRLKSEDLQDDGQTQEEVAIGNDKHEPVESLPKMGRSSSSDQASRLKPLKGIVRRRIVSPMAKKGTNYLRVYPSHDYTKQEKENGENSIKYINLPDADNSHFSAHVKEEENCKKQQQSRNENFSQRLTKSNDGTRNTSMQENKIGDCGTEKKYSTFSFWKAAEDVAMEEKLQRYVEAMVRKVADEFHNKQTSEKVEKAVETDETVCKSQCSCKVCLSNKSSLKEETDRKLCGTKKCSLPLGKISRQYKPIQKCTNLQSEESGAFNKRTGGSKTNISGHHNTMGEPLNHSAEVKPKGSYVVVSSNDDPTDDLYLKRRMGKRVSTNYGH